MLTDAVRESLPEYDPYELRLRYLFGSGDVVREVEYHGPRLVYPYAFVLRKRTHDATIQFRLLTRGETPPRTAVSSFSADPSRDLADWVDRAAKVLESSAEGVKVKID